MSEMGERSGVGGALTASGSGGQVAASVVGDIGAALAELEPSIEDASLSRGAAGIALFHAYAGDERSAVACLERATSAMRSSRMGATFFSGFTGVAWAIEHLRRRGVGVQRDRCLRIDEALLRVVERTPWERDLELIGGVVGVGVYACERLPHDNGVRLLTAVVDRLAKTAQHTPEGVTWESRAEWFPEPFRGDYPARFYHLGMALGVPGVVALLGLACGAGVAEDVARPLLRDAVDWLLAQRLDAPAGCYPRWLTEGKEPVPARLAWCVGDPGVAAALAVAGRQAGEPAWVEEAAAIARVAAARPEADTGVVDAVLCHGSAGLAHLFGRLAAVTGMDSCGRRRRTGSIGLSRSAGRRAVLPASRPGSSTHTATWSGCPTRAC